MRFLLAVPTAKSIHDDCYQAGGVGDTVSLRLNTVGSTIESFKDGDLMVVVSLCLY
jgi:hypothetical protein